MYLRSKPITPSFMLSFSTHSTFTVIFAFMFSVFKACSCVAFRLQWFFLSTLFLATPTDLHLLYPFLPDKFSMQLFLCPLCFPFIIFLLFVLICCFPIYIVFFSRALIFQVEIISTFKPNRHFRSVSKQNFYANARAKKAMSPRHSAYIPSSVKSP